MEEVLWTDHKSLSLTPTVGNIVDECRMNHFAMTPLRAQVEKPKPTRPSQQNLLTKDVWENISTEIIYKLVGRMLSLCR
jgi:hypothetical protein